MNVVDVLANCIIQVVRADDIHSMLWRISHNSPNTSFLSSAQLCRTKCFFQVRGRLCHRGKENGAEKDNIDANLNETNVIVNKNGE